MTVPGNGLSDEQLLDTFEKGAFNYFVRHVNAGNGLVADRSATGAPASIAVVGFALSSYPVGVERGWMTRDAAAERTIATLRFFWHSAQNETPGATGYKGFFYHFLDMKTGARVWQSELSMIDTALFIAGALVALAYFDRNSAIELEIRQRADALYQRIDWQWALGNQSTLRQGWKPEGGFLHYGWEGYSEGILLYILALASPTSPVAQSCYTGWTTTYQWENIYGHDYLYAGPLFIHHYSHAWIDFAGIRDRFMREKGCDYFENSRRATCVQREYAKRNPYGFTGYGENCWGLTANDGPGFKVLDFDGKQQRFFGYAARGVPFGIDDGTIGPGAVLASVPFAPDVALPALRHMCAQYPRMMTDWQLPSGFNPTFPGSNHYGWVSQGSFGLDQGIGVLMVENYRSGLIWKLMRQCPYIARGLRNAGFGSGWLS